MQDLAIISHPDCSLHVGGEQHPESPERVKVIQDALANYPFRVSPQFYKAPMATFEQLNLAHDKAYIDWIISIAPRRDSICLDEDTCMNAHTLTAAHRAAGAVILAVDLMIQDKARVAFCNVRPPGHHAEREKAMGFCFFNNVAIGVLWAIKQYELQRIAIIDFDVHHGNGTQSIFQRSKQVLYCSSFQHPFYPGYEMEMDNPHILSVPLAAGTTGGEFRKKVASAWFDELAAFRPQLIFFSAGFDAHQGDPLAGVDLHDEDYVWLTEKITKIAKVHCDGRMISVLEGGYNLDVLASCVPKHVNAMLG